MWVGSCSCTLPHILHTFVFSWTGSFNIDKSWIRLNVIASVWGCSVWCQRSSGLLDLYLSNNKTITFVYEIQIWMTWAWDFCYRFHLLWELYKDCSALLKFLNIKDGKALCLQDTFNSSYIYTSLCFELENVAHSIHSVNMHTFVINNLYIKYVFLSFLTLSTELQQHAHQLVKLSVIMKWQNTYYSNWQNICSLHSVQLAHHEEINGEFELFYVTFCDTKRNLFE